jgi:uncharacterized caspase-like protein
MWKAVLPAAVALVTLGLSLVSGEVVKRGSEQKQVLALVQTMQPDQVNTGAIDRAAVRKAAVQKTEPQAGRPVALVIGNAAYPDAGLPLAQPINNAHALAAALKDNGFDVTLAENLTKVAMEQTFETFKSKVQPGATVLVFFSGFGIQAGRQTYMVPVNAHIWNEADVRRAGVSLEPLLADIDAKGAGAKLVVLDASRRNPFERRFRSLSTGLAALHAPDDTLVMYAAAPGKVISDGEGDVSPFVDELINQIHASSQNAETAFNQTRLAVSRASHRERVPWVSSSLAQNASLAPAEPAKKAQHSAR